MTMESALGDLSLVTDIKVNARKTQTDNLFIT